MVYVNLRDMGSSAYESPIPQRRKTEVEGQALVLSHFTKADQDRDSRLNYEEFETFYIAVSHWIRE